MQQTSLSIFITGGPGAGVGVALLLSSPKKQHSGLEPGGPGFKSQLRPPTMGCASLSKLLTLSESVSSWAERRGRDAESRKRGQVRTALSQQ